MRRREFITMLGGAAAWPLAARAQQPKIIRLGYLEPQRPTEAVAANLRRQFLFGLRDLGYVEGHCRGAECARYPGHGTCDPGTPTE